MQEVKKWVSGRLVLSVLSAVAAVLVTEVSAEYPAVRQAVCLDGGR